MAKLLRDFFHTQRVNSIREGVFTDDNVLGIGTHISGKKVVFVQDIGNAINAYGQDNDIEYRITDPFKAFSTPYTGERKRPFYGGNSIGSVVITAGTAGLKVRDKATGKDLVLSNNHVLAMNGTTGGQGPLGLVTVQPGPYDGGVAPADRVGSLSKYVSLALTGNRVDCAVATLDSPDLMDLAIENQGYVPAIGQAFLYQQVRKCGRTTGWNKRGMVTMVDLMVQVTYPPDNNPKVRTFDDCILVEGAEGKTEFGGPGDSGSAVLDFWNNNLIGLLFAGNDVFTILCKATNVFSALGIELIPPPELTRTQWLDLSHWNGPIQDLEDNADAANARGIYKVNIPDLTPQSFTEMKSKGIEGVILKVSQGVTIHDPAFADFYDHARAAGLRVGGYHFNDPSLPAAAQANNFITGVGNRQLDITMLDNELTGYQTPETISSVTQMLFDMISTWHGKPTLNYTSVGFWNDNVLRWTGWEQYPLMIAYWTKRAMSPLLPADYSTAVMWQTEVNKNGSWYGVGSTDVDVNTTYYSRFKPILDGETDPHPPTGYSLTIQLKGNGYVAIEPMSDMYEPGTDVKLTAVPDTNWHFTHWEGDLIGSENPITMEMNSNKLVTAVFEQEPSPSGKTEFTTYMAEVVNGIGLNVRRRAEAIAPIWFVLPKGEKVHVLSEIYRGPEDIWVEVGEQQYCAFRYRGITYLKYL